jgi:hypothetical protein
VVLIRHCDDPFHQSFPNPGPFEDRLASPKEKIRLDNSQRKWN